MPIVDLPSSREMARRWVQREGLRRAARLMSLPGEEG
jgi:hypothetical protein